MNEKPDYNQQYEDYDLHPEGTFRTIYKNGETLRVWVRAEWVRSITAAVAATEEDCF